MVNSDHNQQTQEKNRKKKFKKWALLTFKWSVRIAVWIYKLFTDSEFDI